MEGNKINYFKFISEKILIEELKKFNKIMNENNFEFFLIGGCCVGLAREGKLLKHDKDIDIGIMEDVDTVELIKVLKKNYSIVHEEGVKNGKIIWAKQKFKDKFIIFEIQVHYRKDDIVFMNRDMGESFNRNWREGRLQWHKSYFDNLDSVTIDNIKLKTPSPLGEYLAVQHSNWKIPKEYSDWRYNVHNLEKGWL
jgi:hypothetical protein